jgi:hypothetical protein
LAFGSFGISLDRDTAFGIDDSVPGQFRVSTESPKNIADGASGLPIARVQRDLTIGCKPSLRDLSDDVFDSISKAFWGRRGCHVELAVGSWQLAVSSGQLADREL